MPRKTRGQKGHRVSLEWHRSVGIRLLLHRLQQHDVVIGQALLRLDPRCRFCLFMFFVVEISRPAILAVLVVLTFGIRPGLRWRGPSGPSAVLLHLLIGSNLCFNTAVLSLLSIIKAIRIPQSCWHPPSRTLARCRCDASLADEISGGLPPPVLLQPASPKPERSPHGRKRKRHGWCLQS